MAIPCAQVELAVFQGIQGSSSESFIQEDQNLFHGNQILAVLVRDYDPAQRFDQSAHTLDNIWLAFEQVFEDSIVADSTKARFAEFLVLDAVIGNTDRHHENWGVVGRRSEGRWVEHLAESFDHASSLGRELHDKRREGLLDNCRVGSYAEKASGGIYWAESDKGSPSPLQLVRLAHRKYPDLMGSALGKLSGLDNETLIETVTRIPPEWMTDPARRFVIHLISYNLQQLRRLT